MLLPAYLPTHTLGLATACDCPACPHLLLPCPRVLPHCPHLPLPTPATAHSCHCPLHTYKPVGCYRNCPLPLLQLPPCVTETAPMCYCPHLLLPLWPAQHQVRYCRYVLCSIRCATAATACAASGTLLPLWLALHQVCYLYWPVLHQV